MTVRLPADQAEDLEAVAQAEGIPVAEVIRRAVAEHIEGKMRDPGFQTRLRRQIERNRRVLRRLARH